MRLAVGILMSKKTEHIYSWNIFLKLNIILALVYAFFGYLSSLLTLPLSYTAFIWPAAGIALGAILVYGTRILPGIFIGAFSINLHSLLIQHNTIFSPIHIFTITIIFSCGTVFQAVAGRYLLKKTIGLNNSLYVSKNILFFILLIGPVCGCFNAFFSTTLFYLFHFFPRNNLFISMGTWWIGDSLGHVVFTPLFLILFARPAEIWRKRFFPIAIPLFISFLATEIVYIVITEIEPYSPLIWFFLVGGFLFCCLMAIMLFILDSEKGMIQKIVGEKTRELATEHAKNTLLLQSAGEGICQVNTEGKATYINPAAALMLGYTQEELLGKNIHAIAHHSHPDGTPYLPKNCPMLTSLTDGKKHKIHNEMFWRKDGSGFWIDYHSSPLLADEKIIGAVVLFSDVSKRHESEVKLAYLALHDTLTGIPNRLSFLQDLPKAIARAKRNKTLLAVCFLDLDNFKTVNDTLGHSVGDALLKTIVKLLKPLIRETDFMGRLGGDEFALILENVRAKEELNAILNRYLNRIRQPIKINEQVINVTLSIGVALYPGNGDSSEELLKNADIAMYRAKNMGRDRHEIF